MRGGEHKSVEKRLKKVTPNLFDLDMESLYHQVFDLSGMFLGQLQGSSVCDL